MKQIFQNARIATMAEGSADFGLLENAVLTTELGRITAISGAASGDSGNSGAEVIDCKGMTLTPGLIDCHTHLVYAGDRSLEFDERLSGRSYAELSESGRGIHSTVDQTRTASRESLYRQSANRLTCLLAEGVTTVEIKSGYGLDIDTEARMLNVALDLAARHNVSIHKTFLGAHAIPKEYSGKGDAYIDFVCQEMLPVLVQKGLVDSVDAFCETVGFTAKQVARLFTAADALGVPVRLHAEQLSHSGGVALAAQHRALSVDHIEYMKPSEAELLATSGTTAVLLPGAFYFLRETKLPPIGALRDCGVRIAVATDSNPGSSPICSLLTVMNMSCLLFGLTPEEALAGVTRNAAHAVGEGDLKGSIEVGKQADLALWDVQHPAELAYRIGENRCSRVWVNGKERQ